MAKKYYQPAVDPYYGPDQTHEVGSFPVFIGEPPPEPYQYDPRQVFNPEDIGPVPPGREKEFLLLDEQNQSPDYLPTNSAGETNSEGPEYGPEPPTFHATNVADTARKWGEEGQDYTFLAESPGAMKTAEELGSPRVMRGYTEPETPEKIGPEPKPGELDEMGQFKGFWGQYVNEKYKGRDPLEINPAEEGIKAEEAARSKYALELMNRPEGSAGYKAYEKLITDAKNDAIKRAEWDRKMGEEDRKMAQGFFKDKLKASRKTEKGPNPETRANVQAAQKYTEAALYGPNAWQNYELTEEDLEKLESDKTYFPKNRKVKERILTDVNRVRALAGLPPITEKPVQVPMREFRDWGLFRTGEKTVNEPGFRYEEGQAPAARAAAPAQRGAAPQIVRTGTLNGRRVVQYADGRTEYAPN